MTLEHADKIAERIIALPQLYESPEKTPYNFFTFSYGGSLPWNRNTHKTEFSAENIFSAGGYSKWPYSLTITDWEKTGYGHARYITIDDLKMMAYVGIEYARAKLYGWRFRYGELGEEPSTYPRGYIVRTNDGRRYVKRTPGGYAPPNHLSWTPMQRMPGFQTPQSGVFEWEADRMGAFPSTFSSKVYFLGSLEGSDDILKTCANHEPFNHQVSFSETEGSVVKGGGFAIHILQRPYGMENAVKYDESQSIVCFQKRVYPIYQIYYTEEDRRANNQNYYIWQTVNDDEAKLSRKIYIAYSSPGMVSLKKGVVYDVYVKFDNAELQSNVSNMKKYELCSYARIPTRMTAPYMWRSQYI